MIRDGAEATDPEAEPGILPEHFGIGRLFWHSREAVVIADAATGRIALWNPAAEAMFGYTAAEAHRLTVDVLVPEHLRPRHHAGLAAFAATGHGAIIDGGLAVELPALHKTGAHLVVELSLNAVEDAAFPGRYVLAVIRDVTRRRRAEDEARHVVEERFRLTFAHAPFSVQLFAPDGRTLQVNRAWEELWGVTLDQIGDYNVLHDAQLVAKGIMPLIERAFAGEPAAIPPIKYEPSETVPVPGAVPFRWVRANIYPVKDEVGAVREVVLVHEDITERVTAEEALRESEVRLRLALRAARMGIWDWDIVAGGITWSETVEALHGMAPGAFDGRFETWIARVHPEDRGRIAAEIQRALEQREMYEAEFRIVGDDGSVRWLFTQGQGSYDTAGRPARMLGATLDVSDRKRAETERERLLDSERAARAEAEAANLAKDEFLSVLSHELRTPLTPILGFTDILRRRGTADPRLVAHALDTIERSARVQARLVSDLLDVSRIVTGKMQLEGRPVGLDAVIAAAVESVRLEAEQKGVRLGATLNAAPRRVIGDADRLQQVVWNLLINALKFTPAGGAIDVRLRREGGDALIVVRDSGCGIDPDVLPHIFERFRQADSSSTRAHGGLGLGLAIVRHLAEAHGGSVMAESAGEGRGATFTVRLPLAAPGAHEPGRAEIISDPVVSTPLAGVKVLVVEDDHATRELLGLLLQDAGARVTAAGSAAEARAVLDREPPDVLVADIGMPGEDGYALVTELRSRAPAAGGTIPAVAVTAYAGREDRERALAAGFQQHLAKPVDAAALVAAVAALAAQAGAKR